MKEAGYRASLRAALPVLLGLVFVGAGLRNSASADVAVTDQKEDSAPKVIYPPEVEAKFTEFFSKVAEAKRKLWNLRMKKEVEEVTKITSLNDEGAKALEASAVQATDRCIEGWSAKMKVMFRRETTQEPEEVLQMLDQILPQVEMYAQQDFVADAVQPSDDAAWIESLKRTLTTEQAATWDKVQAERKLALEKEIGEFLKASTERTREQHNTVILAKSAEIKLKLALPKDRAEKLDALGKSVADQTAGEWRVRAEKALLSTAGEQRQQILKNRQFYLATEEKDLPTQQAMWKDGVARLLSADELKRLENMEEERKSRRVRVMGQMMLSELDEKIAFTTSQRQQLQPMAERLVTTQPSLFPQDGPGNYHQFAPIMFFAAGSKATAEEMKPILDASQGKHWQEVCNAKTFANSVARRPAADAGVKQPSRSPEPEELEHAISDFLAERAATERKRVLAMMILRSEDAARVAQLPAEVLARLQTAARGAAEEVLVVWKTNAESNVRAQVRDATAQNVKQRLASIEDYSFGRVGGTGTEKQVIWDRTVRIELTDTQRAAWQKEVDERSAYREKSIAAAIMAEFDRKTLLTEEQWKKLEPLVAGVVKDYGPDISRMFSSFNSTPWYLQSYSMFIPLAGVPENDLKAILAKEQWDRWTGSNEFGNSTSYWGNIQQSHAQRVKAR